MAAGLTRGTGGRHREPEGPRPRRRMAVGGPRPGNSRSRRRRARAAARRLRSPRPRLPGSPVDQRFPSGPTTVIAGELVLQLLIEGCAAPAAVPGSVTGLFGRVGSDGRAASADSAGGPAQRHRPREHADRRNQAYPGSCPPPGDQGRGQTHSGRGGPRSGEPSARCCRQLRSTLSAPQVSCIS